jgi:AraC-like DNA-binding protein
MADNDPTVQDPEPIDDGNADPTTPDPASVGSSYATQQELQELRSDLAKSQQTNELLQQLVDRTAQPSGTASTPAEPAIDDVTDDQLVDALQNGTGEQVAKLFRKAVNAGVEKSNRAIRKELGELRSMGTSTFAEMSQELASSKMPLLKEYPEIKQAFESELKQIPDEYKANPRYLQSLYSRIVGDNIQTIVQRQVEAAVRKAREPEQPSMPTTATGRGAPSPDANAVPDVVSFAGQQGARLLQEKGLDGDSFARKLGYDSWEDYVEVANEIGDGPIQ